MSRDHDPIEIDIEALVVDAFSTEDLANFGLDRLAYIRPIEIDGEAGFGIFAADGSPLGVAPERDMAFAAAFRHDLLPLSTH